jgi:hypothetical protein
MVWESSQRRSVVEFALARSGGVRDGDATPAAEQVTRVFSRRTASLPAFASSVLTRGVSHQSV